MLPLSAFRWIVLILAIIGLLGATVLFDLLVRRPLRAWLRFGERLTQRWSVPLRAQPHLESPNTPANLAKEIPRTMMAMIENDRILRAWQAFVALGLIVLWWWLGTPAGAAWWLAASVHQPS